ncbi:MAG: 6-phosphogluconolactonase [Elusimicrobiales bacterium]|nr:6-phosphogluconolactonase [Elusimicrobiales bacterium]
MGLYIGNYKEISYKSLELFLFEYYKNVKDKDFFSVVVCGGKSPQELYRMINESKIDFSKILFFISDERVTNDVDELNYLMIKNTLFKNVKKYNFYNINPLSEHSIKIYNGKISYFLTENFFDLLILGIGYDGHLASLFEKEYLEDSYVIKTRAPLEYKIRERITLNFKALNKSKRCIFIVSGEKKSLIKKKIISGEINSYPFSSIVVSSDFFIEDLNKI